MKSLPANNAFQPTLGLTAMRLLVTAGLLLYALPALSGQCEVAFEAPSSWKQDSQHSYKLPTGDTSLEVRCSLLKRSLSDPEFMEYTGEQEIEESPPLRKFGPWRGRIWVMNDARSELEWRVLWHHHYVQVMVRSAESIPHNVQQQISEVVASMKWRCMSLISGVDK